VGLWLNRNLLVFEFFYNMKERKYFVLPIEGNAGKYVVVNLKNSSSVLIAQSARIFDTHTDILTAFEDAQKESPEEVIKRYERYEKLKIDNYGGIRNRRNLVQALEEFSEMPRMRKGNLGLEGGGKYRLTKGILTLYGTSETYWPVNKTVLEQFKYHLEKFYRKSGNPLEKIVLRSNI